MNLLLVLSSIFLVASAADTLYLKLKLKNVTQKIADSVLKDAGDLVPGLVKECIPDQYSNVTPVVMDYLYDISFVQEYRSDSQESDIVVYFPGVPAEYNDQVLSYMQSYTNNASEILAVLLPTYLQCGQCQWNGLSTGLTSLTNFPDPAPVGPGSIVGLQLVVQGADKLISQRYIDIAKVEFPNLLSQQLDKDANVNLDSVQKKILKDFFSKVEVTQTIDPGKLKLRLTFPQVPSSYVILYMPLFGKYISQNPGLFDVVTTALPTIFGCSTGCWLDPLTVFTEKITPTASFKHNGNSASSLSVGFGLLITIVAVAV